MPDKAASAAKDPYAFDDSPVEKPAATKATRAAAGSRRKYERLPFPIDALELNLVHPGGSTVRAAVKGLDISAGGVCVIHSGFAYPNTPCRLKLRDLLGRERYVDGRVSWCQYVSGRSHRLGIQFKQLIDPRLYVEQSAITRARASMAMTTPENQAQGVILILDDQKLDRELMKRHLNSERLVLVTASSIAEALDGISKNLVDVLVCDLEIGDQRGEDAIAQLRAAGFGGQVFVISAESNTDRLDKLREMAVHHILAKPYNPTELRWLIESALERVEIPVTKDPLYSELEYLLSETEPVQQFIQMAKEKATEIARAADAENLATLRTAVRALKSTGDGYGFPLVAKAAGCAITAIDESQSAKGARDAIRRLQYTINRLAVRNKSAGKTR